MAFSKPRLKILIVDDCAVTRTLLGRLLEPYYVVATVAGAVDALELVKKEENIDLFLLDVTMPEMDGLGFFGVNKKNKKKKNPDK